MRCARLSAAVALAIFFVDGAAAQIPTSTFVKLEATGHCPNLSAPEETVAAIKAFL